MNNKKGILLGDVPAATASCGDKPACDLKTAVKSPGVVKAPRGGGFRTINPGGQSDSGGDSDMAKLFGRKRK